MIVYNRLHSLCNREEGVQLETGIGREQTLLQLRLPPGKQLYASRFRELLAKGCNLPPEFFRPEAGSKSPPLIRIVGGKSWVGILGDGARGAELVEAAAGPAIRLATTEVDRNVQVVMQTPTLGVEAQDFLTRYWVRELVVKCRTQARREATPEVLAEQVVLTGLKRVAQRAGLDDSLFEADLVFRIENANRPRGLRISTTDGDTNEFATLMDVEFTINRKLSGYWFVGNMTSRGYGRIGRDIAALRNGPDKERSTIK